jgi:hypothetical protein
MSSPLSSKSNRAKFSSIRDGVVDERALRVE